MCTITQGPTGLDVTARSIPATVEPRPGAFVEVLEAFVADVESGHEFRTMLRMESGPVLHPNLKHLRFGVILRRE